MFESVGPAGDNDKLVVILEVLLNSHNWLPSTGYNFLDRVEENAIGVHGNRARLFPACLG
jgi:hypothetical protein